MVAVELAQPTRTLPLLSLLVICQQSDLMITVLAASILLIFHALRQELVGLHRGPMHLCSRLRHSCSL